MICFVVELEAYKSNLLSASMCTSMGLINFSHSWFLGNFYERQTRFISIGMGWDFNIITPSNLFFSNQF